MQEWQCPFGGRRPRLVIHQPIDRLQPGAEAALGLTDDRLFGLRGHSPLTQPVAVAAPGMDAFNGTILPSVMGDGIGDDDRDGLVFAGVFVQRFARTATNSG